MYMIRASAASSSLTDLYRQISPRATAAAAAGGGEALPAEAMLECSLLAFQRESVRWALRRERGGGVADGTGVSGGVLAEEMGLGKTVELLTLILSNPPEMAGSSQAARLPHLLLPPLERAGDAIIRTRGALKPLRLVPRFSDAVGRRCDGCRLQPLPHEVSYCDESAPSADSAPSPAGPALAAAGPSSSAL